jgi:hypothetical protein
MKAPIAMALVTVLAAQWTPVATVEGDPVMRGLPRDAIPAIHEPVVVTAADATFMRDDEHAIGVAVGATVKAYSTWHLNAHEIVNDTVAGRQVAVTWCPLCYTGIVYTREVDGRTLRFGVSGMLWRENLVMYDLETDSWWSQATGRAIRGDLEGRQLDPVPSLMVSWRAWRERHPDTLVLKKSTPRDQTDAYARYHAGGNFGVTGRLRRGASAVPDKARVLGFRLGESAFAVRLDQLPDTGVLIHEIAGATVVVAAAADRSGARVYRAGPHAFEVRLGQGRQSALVDRATGTRWEPFNGTAVEGALAGERLEELPTTLRTTRRPRDQDARARIRPCVSRRDRSQA